jgi:hypothetical protein
VRSRLSEIEFIRQIVRQQFIKLCKDMRMKRRHFIGILVAAGLLATGALVVEQSKVSPDAIASSVTRTPELLERAWRLPVAVTFNRQLTWQSNGSRCGPASLANAYRSLGEAATTES